MSGGFAFDFDDCQAAEPAEEAPVEIAPVPLHPLAATPLTDLLTAHAACTKGESFEEVLLEAPGDNLPEDERRSLIHVVGQRIAELQMADAPADGAEGGEAGGDEDDAGEAPASGAGGLMDVVPGKYFGGLKVWSCAVDLALAVHRAGSSANVPATLPASGATPYLELLVALKQSMSGAGAKVMELGCGHGLPGMAALACGALDVSFHDYNYEVVEACLLRNLCATFSDNLRKVAISRRKHLVSYDSRAVVRAGSGDWGSLAPAEPDTAEPILFDVILGADVTFDDASTDSFVACVARLLRPGGAAFIGTKRYYFGTGGGVGAIEAAVHRHRNVLEVALDVATHTAGDGMHRHILAVRRHS